MLKNMPGSIKAAIGLATVLLSLFVVTSWSAYHSEGFPDHFHSATESFETYVRTVNKVQASYYQLGTMTKQDITPQRLADLAETSPDAIESILGSPQEKTGQDHYVSRDDPDFTISTARLLHQYHSQSGTLDEIRSLKKTFEEEMDLINGPDVQPGYLYSRSIKKLTGAQTYLNTSERFATPHERFHQGPYNTSSFQPIHTVEEYETHLDYINGVLLYVLNEIDRYDL